MITTSHERAPDYTHLRRQVQAYRARCFAAANITPLQVNPADVPKGWGWTIQHGDGWIVTRSSYPTPGVLRSEVLIAIADGVPVWAIFDEGLLITGRA